MSRAGHRSNYLLLIFHAKLFRSVLLFAIHCWFCFVLFVFLFFFSSFFFFLLSCHSCVPCVSFFEKICGFLVVCFVCLLLLFVF